MEPVARWPVNRPRLYGGGAWVIAAGLAIGGTFAPLFELRFGRESAEVTAWGANGDDAGILFPDFGVTIVVGAVLVVIAAVLALTSARLHPASAPVLAARLIGIGATGVVIGTTATLFLLKVLFEDTMEQNQDAVVGSGLGMWLLIASAVVGITGTVLMIVPKRGSYDPDPETPPMGIPIVRVLEPEFDVQPEEQKGA